MKMEQETKKVIEAFAELPLSKEFVETSNPASPSSVKHFECNGKSTVHPTIICSDTNDKSLEDDKSVDINYNHLNDQSPNDPDKEATLYDRNRRRSSRLSNLKSDLIANGAIFRPPFTPSNSLCKNPHKFRSPRGSIVEIEPTSGMRSTSVRPGSRTSSAASGSRAPSLPSVPKNPKYANVQSRTVNKSDHQAPVSQVKITHKPLRIEAKSKVGSMDYANRTAQGGDKKIFNKPLQIEARSKIGSLQNIGHVASGGDKKVPIQRLNYNVKSKVGSWDNATHVAGGGQNKVPTQKLKFKEQAKPRIDSHIDIQKLQQQKNGKDSGRSSASGIHNSSTFNK